jgi:alcohol dehydrogenase
MRNINYFNPTILHYGWGRVSEVGKVVAKYGKKCLMVTGSGASLETLREKVTMLCQEAGIEVIRYNGVKANPTTDMINEGTKIALDNNVDVVLGLGGGSPIDAAKAIAVGATHEGEAWDYRIDPFGKNKSKPIEDKLLPVITLTTTAGTGTEVTLVSVITNSAENLKYALAGPLLYPKESIVDPELTLTVPPHITASTGFDAFCHNFESLLNKNASPYTDIHALEGIRLVIKYLSIAIKDGSNREAREALSWANTLGGYSITNAGTTLPHGIGMAIGGNAPHIAHGEALAIMYPEINRWTWKHAVSQYATVGRMLNPDLKQESDERAAESACDEMDKFQKDIGMWMNLKDKGVSENILNDISKDNFQLPDYTVHPIVPTTDDVMDLLKKNYDR